MGDVRDAREAWDLGEDDYEHLAPTIVMEYVKLGKGDYCSDPSVRTCAWTHAWLHVNTEVDTQSSSAGGRKCGGSETGLWNPAALSLRLWEPQPPYQ